MDNKITNILSLYPKSRNNLPNEYKKIYRNIYLDNREGIGFGNKMSQFFEKWSHKIIEDKAISFNSKKCLEIGAGNLNHIQYLKQMF